MWASSPAVATRDSCKWDLARIEDLSSLDEAKASCPSAIRNASSSQYDTRQGEVELAMVAAAKEILGGVRLGNQIIAHIERTLRL